MRKSEWTFERIDDTGRCREKPKICIACKEGAYSGWRIYYKKKLVVTVYDNGQIYPEKSNILVDSFNLGVKN